MKGRLLKKTAILALSAVLVTGGVPVQPVADMAREFSVTASAAETVAYYENGIQKTANATLLNPTNDDRTVQSGWYYTTTETYLFPVTISGTVNIILTDGKAAILENGLTLTEGNTLNIYAQSEGTGKLYATSHEYSNAAIGGGYGQNFGTLNIYGGIVIAENIKSGADAAAIGGGNKGSGGTINIYGGSVTADAGTGGNGAGIGAGKDIDGTNGITGGNISIYGGTVVADGGSSCGAGIGGGYQSSGGNIAIYGGNVTATGGSIGISGGAAGIGGGSARGCESITISGGVVNANGGYGSAAIGCGNGYMGNTSCGSITIRGGQVTTSIKSYDFAVGKGVGGGYNGTCNLISLGWSNGDDFLKLDSVNGTVNFTKDFVYENNLTSPVTVGNADWSKKLVPAYSIGTNATRCTINVPSAAGVGATVNLTVTPDSNCDIQSVTAGVTAHSFCHPKVNVFCQGQTAYFVKAHKQTDIPRRRCQSQI